jgi:predicted Zn-dependent protease
MRATVITAALILAIATPAAAQLGGLGKVVDNASKAKKTYDDINFTDDEERQIGDNISVMLRNKYGVVQDPAVHKYVTLVGTVLAQTSTRPNIKWTFIVLDTDGVNAFAAPGGFVHITRGALALIQNEAELADVLAHEVAHVTEKDTIRALQQAKGQQMATANRGEFVKQISNRGFDMILNGQFSQKDEENADKVGIGVANKVGYSPGGLNAFLNRLSERNKGLTDRSGFFASHPATKSRVDAMTKQIVAAKLMAAATMAPRYTQHIKFPPVPVNSISLVAPPTSSSETSKSSSGSSLSNLAASGNQQSSSQTISSAGSRGVNPDRDAKGGPNKGIVIVTVTPAEVDAFRRAIAG